MVNCWASGTCDVTCTAKSDWYLAGKHAVGHLVEGLHQLGSVVLADSENDRLADFTAYRIAQGILKESLAEELVGGIGEEALFELALLEGLLLVLTGVVSESKRRSPPRKAARW
jgi:hypothetical protein